LPAKTQSISIILGRQEGNAMAAYWMWWIAAAALIAAELLTGTFYLLVIGVAVACGGIAAWFAAGTAVQWLTAGVLGVAGTALLHRWRQKHAGSARQPGLDVGQMVRVETWGPNRTARVNYRGTMWDAELAAPDTPQAETMYIESTRGSVLVLTDRRPVGV
jgi:membrane protein implicated in regulation of membrane protease activity